MAGVEDAGACGVYSVWRQVQVQVQVRVGVSRECHLPLLSRDCRCRWQNVPSLPFPSRPVPSTCFHPRDDVVEHAGAGDDIVITIITTLGDSSHSKQEAIT